MLFHERQSRLVAKFDPEGSSFHPKWKFQCLVDTGQIDTGIQICPTLLTVLEMNCKNRWKLRFMHNNRVVFSFLTQIGSKVVEFPSWMLVLLERNVF